MKNEKKHRSAEYLFDELGLIDEKLIAEAENYRSARSINKRNIIAVVAAAAVFLLMFTMLPPLILGNLKNSNDGIDTDDTVCQTDSSQKDYRSSLGEALLYSQDELEVSLKDEDEIDLFDGDAKLIWQYDGEDEFSVVTISSAECTLLLSQAGSGKEVSEGSYDVICRFWITPGDGSVMTPYLKGSAGNIGHGELFGYSPEIEPAENFINSVLWFISN